MSYCIFNRVKADAQEFSSGDSLSSDDSDFNPDNLEALSAKEEYDSEPTTTSSEDESDGVAEGSDAERRRAERKKAKVEMFLMIYGYLKIFLKIRLRRRPRKRRRLLPPRPVEIKQSARRRLNSLANPNDTSLPTSYG